MDFIKDILRRFKLTYAIYNMLHKGRLKHNPPLYKKYGLKKKYYSPISSKDFGHLRPEKITPEINGLLHCDIFKSLNSDTQKSLTEFKNEGYAILRGFFNKTIIDQIIKDVEQKLLDKEVSLKYSAQRKVEFSHHKIDSVRKMGNDNRLINILKHLLNGTPKLYSSINFPNQGSEQRTHADSFHLATYPRGGMAGVWIALEKIDRDNGPISYFPKSHKMNYLTNEDYENEGNYFLIGNKPYSDYENVVEKIMEEEQFDKKIFLAEPGDVLIWHANLMHGGEPMVNKERTRKSVVFHYFREDCIWYHDISQRPCLTE